MKDKHEKTFSKVQLKCAERKEMRDEVKDGSRFLHRLELLTKMAKVTETI